jgi:hypothetical protein
MADNAGCFELVSDPEVVRFIAVPWADEAEHKAFIEARTRGPYPVGQGYWTVRQKSEPIRFLGWILHAARRGGTGNRDRLASSP